MGLKTAQWAVRASVSHVSFTLSSLEMTVPLPWIKLEVRAGRSLRNLVITEVGRAGVARLSWRVSGR